MYDFWSKKQRQQRYTTEWIKLFGRIQNLLTFSIHYYTHYVHLDFIFLLESLFSLYDFPRNNFLKIILHTNNRMSRLETLASASTAMTSSRKYWYQARSSTDESKWGAPLCRITYSVQYTACWSGVSGWSLKIREKCWAFSRYLWQTTNSTA